jgi:hypothetical protein
VLLALACGEPAPPPTAVRGSLPEGEVPLDALSRRHSRLRERLATRGYEELSPVARVFAIEDRGIVLPLDLEIGSCATFVALAATGLRDLRLALFDGEGEEVASDEIPGEGGLVHACPEPPPAPAATTAPYYLAVEARDGTGSVAIAELRSRPGEGEGFEGLFDDVLAPRGSFPDVEDRLAETRSALRARGLSPVDAPRVEWVGEGGALRVPVRFEDGQCYVAIARGSESARDVDLFLFDPAGVEIGRDLGSDATPTIEHCVSADEAGAPGGGRHLVEARAFEGGGAIGVMVLAAPEAGFARTETAALEAALEPERPAGEHAAPDVALGILAAELQERGFAPPIFASRDASIAPGEALTHEIVVGPGCALIVASASHDGMDLDLYLADAAGREIEADTAVHSTARVHACEREPTVLRVAVKAYGRDGGYALALLRAPAAISEVRDLRLEEAIAAPRVRGFEETERWTATLEAGAALSRSVLVPAGRCFAIAAAGAREVADVDLFLRDESGALVASEAGPGPFATVSRCAGDTDVALSLETVASAAGTVAYAAMLGPARAVEAQPEPDPEEAEPGPRAPPRGTEAPPERAPARPRPPTTPR